MCVLFLRQIVFFWCLIVYATHTFFFVAFIFFILFFVLFIFFKFIVCWCCWNCVSLCVLSFVVAFMRLFVYLSLWCIFCCCPFASFAVFCVSFQLSPLSYWIVTCTLYLLIYIYMYVYMICIPLEIVLAYLGTFCVSCIHKSNNVFRFAVVAPLHVLIFIFRCDMA